MVIKHTEHFEHVFASFFAAQHSVLGLGASGSIAGAILGLAAPHAQPRGGGLWPDDLGVVDHEFGHFVGRFRLWLVRDAGDRSAPG